MDSVEFARFAGVRNEWGDYSVLRLRTAGALMQEKTPITGHRFAVLVAGPWCVFLAVLNGIASIDVDRTVVLAAIGGWIIGRWR